MKINKTNILTLCAFLFVVAICLFLGMNEYQMATRKAAGPVVKKVSIHSEYFLDGETDPTQVPDDSKPLLAYIGKFEFKNNSSEPIFIADGIKPYTFAQRVTNLMFKIDKIPTDTMPLRRKISKITQNWQDKGNETQAFFVDYRPKNPDFEAYNQFLYDLKRISDDFKYQIIGYHAIATFDNSWLEVRKDDYIKLKDNSPLLFLTPSIEDLQSDKYLTKLENIGMSFKIKIPVGVEKVDFNRNKLKQNSYYGSGLKVIDKDFVKPKDILQVGFLPKFLDKKINPQED